MGMVMVFEFIVDHKTCGSKGMQNLAPKINLSNANKIEYLPHENLHFFQFSSLKINKFGHTILQARQFTSGTKNLCVRNHTS